jgi:cytochrome c biogenesis protein CcmG/thiol:disulfide interchange protein DsbE
VTQLEEATARDKENEERGRRIWLFLPLVLFALLVALFYFRLGVGDPSRIPSALLNKPVPDFSLPAIEGGSGSGLAKADLSRGIHLVNVWASWCGPCRVEHPILMRLAGDQRFDVVGINYKDVPENAARFLGALGNPFAKIGADRDGKVGIDWGVYGVPETFVVKDGIIVHKFIGPLSEDGLASDLMPAIEKAIAGVPAS